MRDEGVDLCRHKVSQHLTSDQADGDAEIHGLMEREAAGSLQQRNHNHQ